MTQDQLPEHLLLAVAANRLTGLHAPISKFDCTRIAEEIVNLRAGYAAARLEIESLHSQLEAIGAGGVEPLRGGAQAAPPTLTEQQANDMGAKGAPATDAERLLFEAWMRGHCWALCATWDGKCYRSDAEQGGNVDPRAMNTRQLWAAWRDRAALAAQAAPGVPAGCVLVPLEAKALYDFMCAAFTPLTGQQEEIWKSLQLAKDAMAALAAQAAPAPGVHLDDLAELSLLNQLIELGNKAAGFHATANSDDGATQAARDVLAERQRQIIAEGWTPEHDDKHDSGEMAGAAGCYARHVNARSWVVGMESDDYADEPAPDAWPWDEAWWKPTTPRRDLVKAGALILAELERIDRAALAAQKGGA